jgi:D-alanyl-D-alanine carboxypeptidase
MKARLFILLCILFIEIGLGATYLKQCDDPLPNPNPQDTLFSITPPQPAKLLEETLNYKTAPITYPSTGILLKVHGDMILAHVNKTFYLPSWYVPPGLVSISGRVKTIGPESLRNIVLPHLEDLFNAVENACGCKLAVLSAYRSYQTQVATHNYWVNSLGQANADLVSARPGHSEHQLGTTVDLTSSSISYQLTRDLGYTCEGKRLAKNAHKYGFVLSYPKGKDAVTGYVWEPWHFRWVGKETAAKIKTQGITLEEFLSK